MNTLITDTIEQHAANRPQHPAIRCLDRRLSYAELDAQSNQLANVLIAEGVVRHARVGIYMDKCLETAVALYGIMKSGAAYVPLDPSAPVERTAQVLAQCGIRHLITDAGKRRKLKVLLANGSALDCLVGMPENDELAPICVTWDQVFEQSVTKPSVKVIEQDLAYIIYTSGSTGTPKGIMHTHHSGLSFANWAADEYELRVDDCLSNHAPLHFDLSIFDFFAGAVAGATTSIIPEEYLKLPPSYAQLIEEQGITVLFTVPFALIQLGLHGAIEQRDFSALRWVIFGGEPFPVKHLRDLMSRLPQVHFDNMYGPAEVNGCTHYTVESIGEQQVSVPIGQISDIADALVVDDDDSPLPQGDAGELLVRTPTMMQGYWGLPELNAAAFYYREMPDGPAQRFYRTGDIVEQRGDGNFMFLGRKDRQVKVRGYRVELDEVEAALVSVDQVEEAVAYALPDDGGMHPIHAEVTLKNREPITETQLLSHIKTRLPWYALPVGLVIRDFFPRTTTGKIDRRAVRQAAMTTVDG